MHATPHGDEHDHGSHEHGATSHGEEHAGETHAHGDAGHECGMGCGVHEEHVAATSGEEASASAEPAPSTEPAPAASNPADSLRALAPSEVPADYPLKKCLVSGESFAGFERVFAFDHEGKTIYLCCPMCLNEFLKTPAKFLKKLEPKKS